MHIEQREKMQQAVEEEVMEGKMERDFLWEEIQHMMQPEREKRERRWQQKGGRGEQEPHKAVV